MSSLDFRIEPKSRRYCVSKKKHKWRQMEQQYSEFLHNSAEYEGAIGGGVLMFILAVVVSLALLWFGAFIGDYILVILSIIIGIINLLIRR